MKSNLTTLVLILALMATPTLGRRRAVAGLSLGNLALGQYHTKLLNSMGPPAAKSDEQTDETTKATFERWSYPNEGLEVDISTEEGKTKSIYRITAVAPCKLKAYRGLNIGSFEVEVKAVALQIKDDPEVAVTQLPNGYRFSWEKTSQTLELTTENGKVSKILLGPSS